MIIAIVLVSWIDSITFHRRFLTYTILRQTVRRKLMGSQKANEQKFLANPGSNHHNDKYLPRAIENNETRMAALWPSLYS